MMKKFLTCMAFVAAMVLPIAAGAVTVNVGDSITDTATLSPGGNVSFEYTAGSNVILTNVGLGALGFSAGSDVGNVMFTITRNMTPVVGPVGFDTITLFNSVAVAGSALANITLLNTEVLTILFTDGISLPVTLNVAFNVISADGAPIVPLPATGIMLLTGLAGAAFVARRKQKKSA